MVLLLVVLGDIKYQRHSNLTIEDYNIEWVVSFVYLGSTISGHIHKHNICWSRQNGGGDSAWPKYVFF